MNRIRKNDQVIVIAGRDKGRKVRYFKSNNEVVDA